MIIDLIEFNPGATVPVNSQSHEQPGIVLRGMQALVVDGIACELDPVEEYPLLGHVAPSAYGGSHGAAAVDVFYPVRQNCREPCNRP